MTRKKVCLNCRIAFSIHLTDVTATVYVCPECNGEMMILPHRFRPPRKTDLRKWEVVTFLIENGFLYQHIDDLEARTYAKYPETMIDAQEFMVKYASQKRKPPRV
jgi:predicted RNA-binding Zn-ribbon protein involved in translation (DUF1610 family)